MLRTNERTDVIRKTIYYIPTHEMHGYSMNIKVICYHRCNKHSNQCNMTFMFISGDFSFVNFFFAQIDGKLTEIEKK